VSSIPKCSNQRSFERLREAWRWLQCEPKYVADVVCSYQYLRCCIWQYTPTKRWNNTTVWTIQIYKKKGRIFRIQFPGISVHSKSSVTVGWKRSFPELPPTYCDLSVYIICGSVRYLILPGIWVWLSSEFTVLLWLTKASRQLSTCNKNSSAKLLNSYCKVA
jgi:hypothetical protein